MRLRAKAVHEMDIMSLLGHTTLQMTARYTQRSRRTCGPQWSLLTSAHCLFVREARQNRAKWLRGRMEPDRMKCDLKRFFAAAGTNYLPQVHNNRAISDFNFPLVFEFWNSHCRKCKLEAKPCRKFKDTYSTSVHSGLERLLKRDRLGYEPCKATGRLLRCDLSVQSPMRLLHES
jgi:hypothetical protein